MFEENKSILEPEGALALAGAEAYCKYYNLKDANVVAIASGANMNFDRLGLVTELADVGRQKEAVLATIFPEELGHFKQFCGLVGPINITEFRYRYNSAKEDALVLYRLVAATWTDFISATATTTTAILGICSAELSICLKKVGSNTGKWKSDCAEVDLVSQRSFDAGQTLGINARFLQAVHLFQPIGGDNQLEETTSEQPVSISSQSPCSEITEDVDRPSSFGDEDIKAPVVEAHAREIDIDPSAPGVTQKSPFEVDTSAPDAPQDTPLHVSPTHPLEVDTSAPDALQDTPLHVSLTHPLEDDTTSPLIDTSPHVPPTSQSFASSHSFAFTPIPLKASTYEETPSTEQVRPFVSFGFGSASLPTVLKDKFCDAPKYRDEKYTRPN
ncbi:hypothetical protein POM88_049934 [Heracleum sosnowskyi]|uniref:ACT-like domain-containing protein n=1 Tax=Heracleum sosnowskyi TaxID=360622 RepID=A0AAD8GXZ9_9APIA|nr:hypothetical protein POM88_049934 [Heracleum sosnowskyi]